jgi:nucleotide-binding universal stress UspA family protein
MKLKPKKLLWPTDFSELSLKAARYACGFRDAFGAELHVIHVVPPPLTPDVSVILPAEAPIAVSDPDALDAPLRGLEKLAAQQFGDVSKVVLDTFYGNPWMGICDYAKRNAIDLIIVSTHGRTGLGHVLIGSTAERIVQHAPCPVLTVKDPQQEFVSE